MPNKEQRTAISSHKTATIDKAWSGPANEARLKSDQTIAYYSRAFAWRDPEADQKTKAAYRFIHHEVSGAGEPGAANIRALRSAIGVLNGARGGTTIPDSERRGVFNHLAKHLRDAGIEPPALRAAAPEFERRSFVDAELRITDKSSDGIPRIEGHAAVFNVLSGRIIYFRERIKPGAFKKTIQESDIRGLWNHDPMFVIGRNKADTLELREDEKGLFYSAKPPDTQWAKGLVESIRRRDITNASFSFRAIKDTWGTEDGDTVREVHEARLFDVGPATFPAYESADTHVRSLAAYGGIDGEKLNIAVAKACASLELTEEDRSVLGESIEFLKSFVQEPAEEDPPHSEEPAGSGHSERKDPERKAPQSLGLLKKKLDLLGIE